MYWHLHLPPRELCDTSPLYPYVSIFVDVMLHYEMLHTKILGNSQVGPTSFLRPRCPGPDLYSGYCVVCGELMITAND